MTLDNGIHLGFCIPIYKQPFVILTKSIITYLDLYSARETAACIRSGSNCGAGGAELAWWAWWGLTYSSGIYYNKPWHRMQQDELAEKLQFTSDTSFWFSMHVMKHVCI